MLRCQKASSAPGDKSRVTNDTIVNLMPKSTKNASNIVTKVANSMWSQMASQAGWFGLSVTLTYIFYVRALQCREEMLPSKLFALWVHKKLPFHQHLWRHTQQRWKIEDHGTQSDCVVLYFLYLVFYYHVQLLSEVLHEIIAAVYRCLHR